MDEFGRYPSSCGQTLLYLPIEYKLVHEYLTSMKIKKRMINDNFLN